MKKYIITDPCYLINDDAAWRRYCDLIFDEKGYMNAWRRYCDLIFDEKGYMNADNGAAFIAEQLGTTVQVASTGYGDWANSLDCVKGPNRLVNDGCFCADAGMVCFCELTPQVERALRDLGPGAYAEIEAEDPVCEFDCTDRDWTRVRITDGASVYMSEECDYEDEDDY